MYKLIGCTFVFMMDAEYSFLKDSEFTLPYKSYGSGDELLLCFHGFGRISDDFHRFEKSLGQKYTLIAFDFLYHGPHSVSVKKRLPVFTPSILSNMVEKLLWEKKKVRCSLIGYSQGGKTVMGLVHKIPHRIHELFVLAPDGMKNNRVRNFIAKTYLGRIIGSNLVKSPYFLHNIIRTMRLMKIISEKVKIFFISNTDEIEKRYRIYHSWITLRNYEIHPKLMNHYFHAKKIRVEFFIGKYDAIITPKSADLFLEKFNYNINLHELACGHDLLSLHSQIEKIILSSTPS